MKNNKQTSPLKRTILMAAIFIAAIAPSAYSQNGVGINASGSPAVGSAMLDVSSTTKGALMPRMTAADRTGIASPALGLTVYQTDAPEGYYYNSSAGWVLINDAASLSGIVSVANGGTGASTASAARTNLGLGIGTNVQAFSTELLALSLVGTTGYMKRTGANTYTTTPTISTGDLSGTLQPAQEPAHTGDVTNPAGVLTMTLPNIVSAGTNPKITYNAKGQVTAGAALSTSDLPALGQSSVTVLSSASIAAPTVGFTAIPGLTQTVSVPTGSVVLVDYDVYCANGLATVNAAITVDLRLFIDGVQQAFPVTRVCAHNSSNFTGLWMPGHMTCTYTLGAGIHTIDVRAGQASSAANTTAAGVGSVLQSSLTVTMVKQ